MSFAADGAGAVKAEAKAQTATADESRRISFLPRTTAAASILRLGARLQLASAKIL
jgi:hypothetical protein